MYHVYAVLARARRGCGILWNWSCRCLWGNLRMLRLEPRSSWKSSQCCNHWVISPAPRATILIYTLEKVLPKRSLTPCVDGLDYNALLPSALLYRSSCYQVHSTSWQSYTHAQCMDFMGQRQPFWQMLWKKICICTSVLSVCAFREGKSYFRKTKMHLARL